MTRTMYDAVNAENIPANATIVAGYVDQIRIPPWSSADWDRFPNAAKVQIVKKASSNFGHVLDVEPGDATPAQAPGWVTMRRAAGLATPCVYMNASTWPAVKAEFAQQNVAPPLYWVAQYDLKAVLPDGAIAKQHTNTAGFDVSVVADFWPGVDSPSPSHLTESEIQMTEYVGKAIPANGFMVARPPGGPGARITIYPGKEPVWVSAVYWWGEGKVGLGGNPVPAGKQAIKVDTITTFAMPNALLAEIAYSSASDFTVVSAG